jgi:hypothetical protein
MSDYRRGLDWWSDLLDSLIQRVTTLYSSLLHTHTLVSTATSSLPLRGSGFQQRTFPFLCVPELSPASATGHNGWTSAVLSLPEKLSHTQTKWLNSTDWLSLKVMLRSTVSRPVCLVVKPPSGAQDPIFITVRHSCVCWCGTPSLTRGRICHLNCCWSSPAQSLSGPSPWNS